MMKKCENTENCESVTKINTDSAQNTMTERQRDAKVGGARLIDRSRRKLCIPYKDVNELTNLCFKLNNVCRITFEDFNIRL